MNNEPNSSRMEGSPILGSQRRLMQPQPREEATTRRSRSRSTSLRTSPRRIRHSRSPPRPHRPQRQRSCSRQPRSASRKSGKSARSRSRSQCRGRQNSRQPRSRSRRRMTDGSSTQLRDSRAPSPRASQPRCEQRSERRSKQRSERHSQSRSEQHEFRSRSPIKRLPHEDAGTMNKLSSMHERRSTHIESSEANTLNLLIQALKSVVPNPDRVSVGSLNNNPIPEFDPSKKEQTITMWLHKINECAAMYGWSQQTIVHYALPKLQGAAKRWYTALGSMSFSWEEWQTKLLTAFPSQENYGQMLSDMLNRRARFGDSLEDYFYDKIALLNRCNIVGRQAIECILHGIDDRTVRLGAEAAQFLDLDKLLTYLRNARNVKINNLEKRNAVSNSFDRRSAINKPSLSRNIPDPQQRSANQRDRPIRCINCKKEGHLASQCNQPIVKCGRCLRIGHETENCYSKLIPTEKAVNRVSSDTRTSDKYYKTVLVNNVPISAFIDLGSDCSMIKFSELSKLGDFELQTDSPSTLRGFGNSIVNSFGKVNVRIEVDGVQADTELIIVPDNVMHVPLMIGQTFTEQSHVGALKTSENFEFVHLYGNLSNKINVHCKEKVSICGSTLIEVYTEPKFTGDIYIEGGLRSNAGFKHYVLSGIYRFSQDGEGQIVINSLESKPFYINKDLLVARGQIACEEKTKIVCNIKQDESKQNITTITTADVKVGNDLEISVIEQLLSLLNTFRHCFAFTTSELGYSTLTEMSISLLDDTPVVYRPYRLAVKEKEIVRQMVDELQENNIIRPSVSSYASPVILVKKKTGDYRLCIDYRALNKKTIKENYPLPLIDDQLDQLAGNEYFTTLDLASGYYQIPIAEQDKYKTAFVTPEGHFEFNRMPFGLANAPAVFQRMIHQVLGNLRHKEALAYLDDIILPSKDVEEGMSKLKSVLEMLSSAGLTLKLSKCVFFKRSVDYLGFEVSGNGIKPGAKKIEAVENFPIPSNQHTVRQFLGLASFFRRFVQGFSIIAKPLTYLLKKDTPWVWGSEQQKAFEDLKKALVNKPTLALYNPNSETELHTDACKIGIAGILLQKNKQGVLSPVAYFSKQTSPEEQNYSSYDLETLAVVASLQKFRAYLIGIKFKIITDCNSLRATFSKRDMLPRVARWWTQMQEFSFDIEYKAGKSMAHVDALSRNPPIVHNHESEFKVQTITEETDWIITVQNADSEIQRIVGILNDPNLNDIVDIKNNYKLKNGKLYRVTVDGDRWVVPKGVRWQVVRQNHDDIGHFAVDKTLEKVKSNFWFPKMRKFIKKYVTSCLECAYAKQAGGKKQGFLHPIEKIDIPFDTVHIDHVGPFVRSSKGNMHILVLIDAFTRYIYLKPVRNTKSSTSIKVLREYFSIFGTPRRIISDRGTSFTSDSFKEFISQKGIKHVLNAVATPRANGQVERYNKVIVDSLTTKCVGSADNKWDDHLPEIQWGINNTFNKGIDKTPAEVLFGFRPKGSSDGKLVTAVVENGEFDDTHRESIRNDVNDHVLTRQESQKERYDRSRCKPITYSVGDLVRVERQVQSTGSSKKLIPKFHGPYRIVNIYDHDRYQIEDTPLSRRGNKKYTSVVSVDKMKPWLNFNRPHDDILSDEGSDNSSE